MPYLIAWFEEAAKTLREIDEDAFTGIAQEARSAGISLVVSLQRASHTQVSTDTRASLGSSWVYGVRTDRDAGFALDGEVLDAGAAPHLWKDKKPGYCYLVANGIPETFWPTPARSYLTPREYLDWVVLTFAAIRAELDPVTADAAAQAAGPHFTQRTRSSPPGTTHTHPTEDVMNPDDHEPDEPDENGYRDQQDQDEIDPERELPTATEVVQLAERSSEKPRERISPAQARQAMEEILDEFEAEGRTVVCPADFMEHCDRYGRSRSWVSGQVAAFIVAGRLAETRETGEYRIIRDDEAA
ncbi:hypothetical protein [Streptomyces sp. AV19]|uniref:hypothetical protein n=1 Tax=Streptomyces sp. AV19 TaxID=2793068 RepID=UPI001F244C7D|nr:hypothetical protein [Streptomyces sp. AV19]MDG4533431.1 hypothetical protein [Streptomyces sp. AV19]